MITLERLGWDPALATGTADPTLAPMRVCRDGRNPQVLFAEGRASLHLPTTLLAAHGPLAVGDWVLARARADGGPVAATIVPRRTELVRRGAGTRGAPQVLAANVDLVFVVLPLDRELRASVVERAVAVAWESGAQPVVLLTKSDLAASLPAALGTATGAAPGVPVHPIAAPRLVGVEAVREAIGGTRTAVLLGPSGAGKSTLANALLGGGLRTGEVRADRRGRHTTTERLLLPLPGGGALIDGPGIRELGLWEAERGVALTFPEIEELAARCRFRDCHHDDEPGCAVQQAVGEGRLDPGRVTRYHKLERELQHQRARDDGSARAEERRKWRPIHKSMRGFSKGS